MWLCVSLLHVWFTYTSHGYSELSRYIIHIKLCIITMYLALQVQNTSLEVVWYIIIGFKAWSGYRVPVDPLPYPCALCRHPTRAAHLPVGRAGQVRQVHTGVWRLGPRSQIPAQITTCHGIHLSTKRAKKTWPIHTAYMYLSVWYTALVQQHNDFSGGTQVHTWTWSVWRYNQIERLLDKKDMSCKDWAMISTKYIRPWIKCRCIDIN